MVARVLICRSNPVAPDPRVEKEALALSSAGYQVSILGWDRTAQLPTHDLVAGSPCYRLPIRAEYGRGLRNLPDLLRWQWGLTRWLVRHHREYDILHACDFDTILPALLCQRLFSKQVVYDIFDFYADHLRATPALLKKAIRALDLRAIGWADGLILADDSRWRQIEGARQPHSAVIYNSPEDVLSQLSVSPRATDAPDHPSTSRLCLAYVGLLQVERGLFELLEVLHRHPEWSLDLAGFGGDQERLLGVIQAAPSIRWHGRVPYTKALQLSFDADVLIATYDPAIPNHRYSSPNKVFEAMMLGKPIIVARDTNMDRIISASDCGLVVPYGDVPALEQALLRLQEDGELRRRLGENGRRAYENSYSWKIMADRLVELYTAMQAARRAPAAVEG